MLESLVASILNRVVGAYVENFDPNQLNIGILSGDVKLRNLRLKRGALDRLHLPLNVVAGHVGSLMLQIPYSNLKGKPVKILVEDVFLLAVPDLNSGGDDDADEERRLQNAKIDRLEVWELGDRPVTASQASVDDDKKNQNFTGSLVTKIIDNLQVTIKNIHIRYEDSQSVPHHPFAAGLTLAELSAVSTNGKWEPEFITEVSAITHKLATLDALAVYWDTDAVSIQSDEQSNLLQAFKSKITDSGDEQFLLRPVNGQGFITLDKQPATEATPKIRARLQFEEFAVGLDSDQYRDMLDMGDRFHMYQRMREHRKLRPTVPVKQDPKGWMQYAAKAVLQSVQDERRQWSWPAISERLEDFKTYRALYKKRQIGQTLTGKDKTEFDALERKYSYDDLVFFRTVAKAEMRSESAKTKIVNDAKRQASSWTSWLWGSSGQPQQPGEDQPLQITDEQRRELYDVLDLDENGEAVDEPQASENQTLLEAEFALQSGSLWLREPDGGAVGSVNFIGPKASFVNRADSFLFSLSLDEFSITDHTHNSKFPEIVKVHQALAKTQSQSQTQSKELEKAGQAGKKEPFFWILFEHHPPDKLADSNLFVKSKSIQIVHNARFIEHIIRFFTPPAGHHEAVDALLTAANKTVEELREQTRLGLEYALQEHKTLNLKLDIQAPIILVPLDTQSTNSAVSIIDAGSITMNSDLVKREVLDEVKSKQASKYSEADWKRLESLMYDRFTISLHDMQLVVADSMEQAQAALAKASSPAHMIDKTTLAFLLEISIVPRTRSLPRCRLSISLGALNAALSDVQYKVLMQTVDAAIPKTEPVAMPPEHEKPLQLGRRPSAWNPDEHESEPAPKPDAVAGQRLFELRLLVERAELSLNKGWQGDRIVDLCLHNLQLLYWTEGTRMGVDMEVQTVLIEDWVDAAAPAPLRKIAESVGHSDGPDDSETKDPKDPKDESSKDESSKEESAKDSPKDLAKDTAADAAKPKAEPLLRLRFVREESTEINQSVELDLAAIRFVISPTTILTLYDYIMTTFASPDAAAPVEKTDEEPVSGPPTHMTLSIRLSSISALLNDNGIVLAKLELASARINLTMAETMQLKCALGAVSMIDMVDAGSPRDSVLRQILSIDGGGDLADIRYETFAPGEQPYQSLVYFRSGSLRLSLVEEPVARIVQFLARLAQMKTVYDQARMLAMDQAIQIEPEKIKLDVVVSTPIVVCPRLGHHTELLTAYLGEIYLQNTYNSVQAGVFANSIEAGIRKVRVSTELYLKGEQKLDILKNADFTVNASIVPNYEGIDRPLTDATVSVNPVQVHLTEYQYQFVMQLVAALGRISSGIGGLQESEVGDLKQKLSDEKHLSSGQAQSWTTPPAPTPDDGLPPAAKLKLEVAVAGVGLSLYKGTEDVRDDSQLAAKALSSFQLQKTAVQADIDKAGTLAANMAVKAFTVEDLRQRRQNAFPQIVPPGGHESYQFMLQVTQHAGRSPHLSVSVDSPKVILAIDYLLALKGFVDFGAVPSSPDAAELESVSSDSDSTDGKQIAGTSPQKSAGDSGKDAASTDGLESYPEPALTLDLNIVDLYLTLLADAANEDTEAIVFKIEQLLVSVDRTSSVSVSKIGLFLTKMKSFDTNRLRIIDDFSLTCAVDDHESRPDAALTSVTAHVEPVVLRISLREIWLIMSIVNKASALFSSSDDDDDDADNDGLPLGKNDPRSLKSRRSSKSVLSGASGAGRGADKAVAKPAAGKGPVRVMGEKLKAEFEGLRVVIIGPEHLMPILDYIVKPFDVNARNWSSALRVDATTEMYANIYSFSKSVWEPLVDSLALGVNVSTKEGTSANAINIFSKAVTDIEVTPALLSIIDDVQSYFTEHQDLDAVFTVDRDEGAPYRIVNQTGFAIEIKSDCQDPQTTKETKTLQPGETTPWSFYDWRVLRENLNHSTQQVSLGVRLDNSPFAPLRSVAVNAVGEHLYILKPDHPGSGERHNPHRLVFDITINQRIKYVTIRSTAQVCNGTAVDMELRLMPKSGSNEYDNHTFVLKAGESTALPVQAVDSDIFVRPDPKLGYGWAAEPVYWRRLLHGDATIECKGATNPFYIQVRPDISSAPLAQHYPFLTINLTAPFELINNLPYPYDYRVFCRDTKRDWQGTLAEGAREYMHVVNAQQLLLLSVQPQGGSDYGRSEFAVINSHVKDFVPENELLLHGHDGQKLKLTLQYAELPAHKGLAIVVSAPYVIKNLTGRTLTISTRVNHAVVPVSTTADGELHAKPKMWSFNTDSSHNRAVLRIDDSHDSGPVSFNAVGSVSEVVVMSHDRQSEMHLGMDVIDGEGRYRSTKVVSLTPRFIICNNTDRAIQLRAPGSTSNGDRLEAGKRQPVGFISTLSNREMCLAVAGIADPKWSAAIALANVGSSFVRLQQPGHPTTLLRIDVVLEGATLFVHVLKAKQWPFSIRNFTDLEFTFWQSNPMVDEDGVERRQFQPIKYRLPPHAQMPYSWDFPAANLKELVLDSGGRNRRVQLAEIGELPPAKFPAPSSQAGGDAAGAAPRHMALVDLNVVADGPQQALVISDYVEEESHYDLVRTRTNATGEFEVAHVDDSDKYTEIKLNLKGIGVSYTGVDNKELCYLTLRNLDINYFVSELNETINWQCQWIQCDNCLAGDTDFPVILYPTVLPKSGDEMKQHPTISGSVTRVTDESYGLIYVKHATMLLQELTIEVDESFLLEIVKLVRGPENKTVWETDQTLLCSDVLHVPAPTGASQAQDMYFEQLHLQPTQINLSFVRTGALANIPLFGGVLGDLNYLVDALTMTIGNINDAPLRFNALLFENVRTQPDMLLKAMTTHYSQEFIYQLHKIIGSADFIGNPVGLFNNISSGVMDLFYEPYLGYTLTDRPQELGIGLAKGGASFMKKSVFGVSDSISKVTGSLAKGLTSMTMDPRFQKNQRARSTRNRPKNALYGFSAGAESFYDSVVSGVTGLARAPLEGATSRGAAGFFSGLGKGLIGVPTKTAIGVLDLASNISEGVRNTTSLFDDTAIGRVRVPRVINSDGIVRPYNAREAVGQMIMRTANDGKYSGDYYLAHTNLSRDKVVVVTLERIMMVSLKRTDTEWTVTYPQLATVVMEHGGLSLKLHGNVRGPFIPIENEDTRRYIYKAIGEAVSDYNRRRETLY